MENDGNGGGESAAPQYIGNYEVLRTIGKGKFAVVYRARKVGDDQVVALKRISVDMMNEKAREKCLKEVRLLQNLDHPNIIRYMDSFITENDLIIVYEWAAAGDLKRQLRKAQEKGTGFEERVIWKYFSQICQAIQHMHEKRIMHRDLKPANIFLTLDGTIKVGDLGLSRELSADTIQAHSKVGTPLYMSPEVLKGDGYDFKSDVWSLGCLLYELAMLKSPFKAEGLNLYSLFQKISNGEYLPLPDNYSEELRQLAYSMINIRPEDRPEVNQVVEVAKRMRQQTANMRGTLQRENSINSSTTPTTTNDAVESNVVQQPNTNLSSNAPNPLSRTPSKTALEAKEEALNNRESRSRESNPYGRRPDSEEANNRESRSRESNPYGRRPDSEEANNRESRSREANRYNRQLDTDPNNRDTKSRETRSRESKSREANQYSRLDLGDNEAKPTNSSMPVATYPEPSYRVPPKAQAEAKDDAPILRDTRLRESSTIRKRQNSEERRLGSDEDTVRRKLEANKTQQEFTNKQATNPDEIGQANQAIALMEIVYSKLIVLRYPMDDPDIKLNTREYGGKGKLLPIHFTCDPKAFGTMAGQDRGYVFNSLSRLIHIVIFLCEKINPQSLMAVQAIDREFGAPMTSAKQLLLAAQRAGEMDEQLAAATPTSISQGYGYNACLLLNHFADCALKAIKFEVKLPSHASALEALDVPMEEDDDEIEDLEVVEGEDEDGHADSEVNELAISASGTLGSSRGRFYFAEMTTIDPELWRQETERVTPLLRKYEGTMNNVGGLSATWRTHLDLLVNHVREVIQGETTNKTKKDSVPRLTSSAIAESISSLRSNLQETLSKIQHSEKLLTGRATFTGFALEYEGYQKSLLQLQEKCTELNAQVSAHNASLAEIEENLEEAARLLEEKTSGENGLGTNSPIVRIKEAIRTLQEELNQMHITISILNNDLLQRRKEAVYNKKSSKKKSKKKNDETTFDDEDV